MRLGVDVVPRGLFLRVGMISGLYGGRDCAEGAPGRIRAAAVRLTASACCPDPGKVYVASGSCSLGPVVATK
jgi:hypothetical protein